METQYFNNTVIALLDKYVTAILKKMLALLIFGKTKKVAYTDH